MATDDHGIRADMYIDMGSPIARNNPGQMYETGLNRIGEFVRRKCQYVKDTEGVEKAFALLLDWYNDVNPNYAKAVKQACPHARDRASILTDVLETGPKLWVPPFTDTLTGNENDHWHGLRNIKKWALKWGVTATPWTYTVPQGDGTVKTFRTEEYGSIGSKYVINLSKIPEISAPGIACVNHIGIPTKPNYGSKLYPVSMSPYKYGEDELRVMSMDCDIREITRFQNLMANSPTGVTVMIKSLLLSENPTRIKRMPISNGELFRTNTLLKVFHNTTATLGVETKNTKIDGIIVPDDLGDSISLSENYLDYRDRDDGITMADKRETRAVNKRVKVTKMLDTITEFED